jgi:hypothetical protein
VTKVLYRSHASISNILNAHNDSIRRIYPRPNRSAPVAADADSMTGLTNAQLSLPEELRFAKLMTWLSITFVICWVPQLVRTVVKNVYCIKRGSLPIVVFRIFVLVIFCRVVNRARLIFFITLRDRIA